MITLEREDTTRKNTILCVCVCVCIYIHMYICFFFRARVSSVEKYKREARIKKTDDVSDGGSETTHVDNFRIGACARKEVLLFSSLSDGLQERLSSWPS